MCGITGFIGKTANADSVLDKMTDAIAHRGPDSAGKFVEGDVALGFRRLSIIDLSTGDQPIYTKDRNKLIFFNGEIYNFMELREELSALGYEFSTASDTEVLLNGYEAWGKALLTKVRGMFTFCIWDILEKELFLARDFFGIKPMYYAEFGGIFMFGSEIKSLLFHPSFVKELNPEALKPYLTFQYSATDDTFFKGVHRLPEGHFLTWKAGEIGVEKYWDAEFSDEEVSLRETIDSIEDVVIDSVKAHKIADVPVGSFLSSGVDSSFVTALLRPEFSFSVGFGSGFNETTEAQALSEKLSLQNISRIIEPDEAFEKFPLIQYHLDEPDSNPSCVPLYFLSELASRKVTVVLSGEGADELFAGYHDYGIRTKSKALIRMSMLLKKLPKKSRYALARKLKKMSYFPGKDQFYRSIAPAEESFIGQALVFSEEDADAILRPPYKKAESVREIVSKQYAKVPGFSEIKKMQYLDLHQWMPKDILLKADKISMAHSIELRVPFLDREVMDVAGTIPSKYLLNAKNTKYAFRKAANRHLPDEWADREKIGFPVPIRLWLREEKYHKHVRALFAEDFVDEFFDREALLKLIDENFEGKVDGRRKIWTIFTFLTWYKVFFVNDELPKVDVLYRGAAKPQSA